MPVERILANVALGTVHGRAANLRAPSSAYQPGAFKSQILLVTAIRTRSRAASFCTITSIVPFETSQN
jgi:hypothetical protein